MVDDWYPEVLFRRRDGRRVGALAGKEQRAEMAGMTPRIAPSTVFVNRGGEPKPAEPEPNRLARSGHINTSAVRANLDDPLIHIRPICSRKRGFEEQEPNGFNAS
jgi:hypothetical protein